VQGQQISDLSGQVPDFIAGTLFNSIRSDYPEMKRDVHYKVGCCIVPGASDRIMGILVQSTDQIKTVTDFNQVTNTPSTTRGDVPRRSDALRPTGARWNKKAL
jgi:hypothetical protein